MSLLRRWFDPIRSSWFYQKPSRQSVLSTEHGLSVYLRLDDVYSYLAVQQLPQLEDILADELKPLTVVISRQSGDAPNQMSAAEWQNYCIQDAKILAKTRLTEPSVVGESPSADGIIRVCSSSCLMLRLLIVSISEFIRSHDLAMPPPMTATFCASAANSIGFTSSSFAI